ncbi:MAG: PKD domain-containing protein [Bacteroidetes bacterium]|nr:PKD domain-containing protein [Bacteroidota bacterium]
MLIPFPSSFSRLSSLLVATSWLLGLDAYADCPNVLNGDGEVDDNPTYYFCTDGETSWTFFPQTDGTWTNVNVNWGDGTSTEHFAIWNDLNPISHSYPNTHQDYVVTFHSGDCWQEAILHKSVSVNPAIVVPQGWPTGACAPATLSFVNESTNVTPDTQFEWIFDDGTTMAFGPENAGATVDHLFNAFTTGCNRPVTLRATNACREAEFGGPASVTIDYINIWDRDNPAIFADKTILCWPENKVNLTNVSEKVCLANGNTQQRMEMWDFGGPYGPGGISGIDWRPWTNSLPVELTFPSTGVYTIELCVENYCGVDCQTIEIVVREPLVASVTGPTESCVGERVNFMATAPEADWYEWDFYGFDMYWYPSVTGNMLWTYNTAGTFTAVVNVGLNNQSDACTASATHTITVKPAPDASIALSDNDGCDSLWVRAEEIEHDGVSYLWTLPDGSNATGPSSPLVFLDQVGAHPFAVEVTGSNGCKRVANAMAHVRTSPAAAFTVGAVCEGNASQFTDLSLPVGSDPITSWSWSFGDGQYTGETHPSHNYDNPGNYTVDLEVSNGYCHAAMSQEVEVFASPMLDISSDITSGCAPLYVQFNASSNDNVTWEFGDDNGGTGLAPDHTYIGSQEVEVTHQVVAVAVDDHGCTTERSLAITMQPSADATFTVSPPSCSPFTPTFTNQSERADQYLWVFEDGTTSNLDEPTHTFLNNTGFLESEIVRLIAYNANGCNDTTQVGVSVFPEAQFDLGFNVIEECSPFTFMAPNIQNADMPSWDFGDNASSQVPNPVHVYQNNTSSPQQFTLTFSGENSFGCVGHDSASIVINPQPVADFSADIQSGCAPLEVTITEHSERGDQFSWNYGDGLVDVGHNGTSHTHTFNLEGYDLVTRAISLTVTAQGGCTDIHTVPVEVYPEVRATPEGDLEDCAPWQASLVAAGYETAPNHTVQWDVDGNASVGAVFQQSFMGLEGADQSLDFHLHVESPFGCTADSSFTATVHHMPVAGIVLSDIAACSGTEISLTDGSAYADNVVLDWGDGSVANNPLAANHTYTNTGFDPWVVQVVQTATTDFGCQARAEVNHTVYPEVTASFLPPLPACAPFTLTLVNQSVNANGVFTWDFGDGSPVSHSAQPNHLYETPADVNSTFDITLHATSIFGCEDSTTHAIEVNATPIADLEVVRQEGCYPLEVTFANQSVGGDAFLWTYGTGINSSTEDSEHTVEFFNPTSSIVTYTTVLTVTTASGCSSQDVAYVEVLPEVEARIEGGIHGCSPLDVEFMNLSDGAVNYDWSFGDGGMSSTTHASHTFFADPGSEERYLVTLVAQSIYGCTDTARVFVDVYGQPQADFILASNVLTFPASTAELTNTSTGGESTSYFWNFGDGQVSFDADPGIHVYDTWGSYDIHLEADNGYCSSVTSATLDILAPTPTLEFSGEGRGCAPLAVAFDNFSQYAQGYMWEFSDGSVRSDDNPVHVFHEPGVYDVTLTVYGFDGTELTETHTAVIEVFPTAEAVFSLNPTQVIAPGQPVYFLNLSEDASSYVWDFGDGVTTQVENPVHEYLTPGVYDVSLTANNSWGCATTYTLPSAVLAEDGGMLVFPDAFTPDASGPNGGVYDPTSYDNDVFRPMHAGVEDYELMVFTKWGEMIFYSNSVHLGWDGYVNGRLAAQDVYAWKASATFSNGNQTQQVGSITLLTR